MEGMGPVPNWLVLLPSHYCSAWSLACKQGHSMHGSAWLNWFRYKLPPLPTSHPHHGMPPALEKIKNQRIHFTWVPETSEKLMLCCLLIKIQLFFFKMFIQFSNRKPYSDSSMEPIPQNEKKKCIWTQKNIFEHIFFLQYTLQRNFGVTY